MISKKDKNCFWISDKKVSFPGMVAHSYNLSIQSAEAGGLQIQNQPRLKIKISTNKTFSIAHDFDKRWMNGWTDRQIDDISQITIPANNIKCINSKLNHYSASSNCDIQKDPL